MVALVIDDSMSMEHWWNDTDGKTAVPGENPVSLQLFPP
jgi:hypothetical protein